MMNVNERDAHIGDEVEALLTARLGPLDHPNGQAFASAMTIFGRVSARRIMSANPAPTASTAWAVGARIMHDHILQWLADPALLD